MSLSHLTELRAQLERRHWRIVSEEKLLTDESALHWKITRPNGDLPLTLVFTPGFQSPFGHFRHESIDESIACHVVGQSHLPRLYFGKFRGQFQKDVVAFANEIDQLG